MARALAALRGAWLAAQALGAEREAETLRAALLGARAVLEERLFDERRGFVRRSPDEAAVGLESARLVTFGFFARERPPGRDAPAGPGRGGLPRPRGHRAATAASSRTRWLGSGASTRRGGGSPRSCPAAGPGDGLGASVAFVLAAFACSREWP
jgi:hypothetical protein